MGWAGSGPDLNVGPRLLGAIGGAIGSGTIATNADERRGGYQRELIPAPPFVVWRREWSAWL